MVHGGRGGGNLRTTNIIYIIFIFFFSSLVAGRGQRAIFDENHNLVLNNHKIQPPFTPKKKNTRISIYALMLFLAFLPNRDQAGKPRARGRPSGEG